MLFINIVVYVVSFIAIWLGSGLIISAAGKFSRRLRLSPFAFSFVFLGLLTSIPEFSVGLQAVADKNPEVFVGNLLGGILVLFLFIIPVLAIFGNGISLKNELDNQTLLFTLSIIFFPALFMIDKRVTTLEGAFLILSYLVMLVVVQRRQGIFDNGNGKLLDIKAYSYLDILKILVGIAIVLISSNLVVEKTLYFAELMSVSPFYISLFVIGIGTNFPELSLAVRAILTTGKKDLVMGDYIGSATTNTLFFGIFTLLSNGEVVTTNTFTITLIFTFIGLFFFYYFSVKRAFISRGNGLFILGIYLLFMLIELLH